MKILVDETLPLGSIKVAPRIVIAPAGDKGVLRSALEGVHKTVYVPSAEVGERVREIIADLEGVDIG